MRLADAWLIRSAALEMDINQSRLYRAIRTGNLPFETLASGQRVVRLSDVQAFLDNPPKPGRPRNV